MELGMLNKYCIFRTESAGVFAGVLEAHNNGEAIIQQARRIWSWEGAASLSQLAVDGTQKPKECRFPCVLERIFIRGVVEIIPATDRARASIESVPIWEEEVANR